MYLSHFVVALGSTRLKAAQHPSDSLSGCQGEKTYFKQEKRESSIWTLNESKFRVMRQGNISGHEGLFLCRDIPYRIYFRVMCGGEIRLPMQGRYSTFQVGLTFQFLFVYLCIKQFSYRRWRCDVSCFSEVSALNFVQDN